MNYEEIGEIRTFWPVFLPTTTTTTTTTTTATTTTTINISFINNSTTLKMDKRILFMAFVFTMVFHFNWKFIVLKENKLLKMFFQTLFFKHIIYIYYLGQYNIIIVYFLSSPKSLLIVAVKGEFWFGIIRKFVLFWCSHTKTL